MNSSETAASIDDQEGGRLRILIIGAGVAGLTLAALLRRQGESPFVIERMPQINDSGYNLAMYPLGVRSLHSLRAHDDYQRRSAPIETYSLYTDEGRCRKQFELGDFIRRYGTYRGITRGELIATLRQAMGEWPVHCDTHVTAIKQNDRRASATFADGSTADFDVIVAADGLNSDTRRLLLGEDEFAYWDSGWSCWTRWCKTVDCAADQIVEYWGSGCFAGAYPVPGGAGVVFGGPRKTMERESRSEFVNKMCKRLSGDTPVRSIIEAFETPEALYSWKLRDVRARVWRKGRVVLLGDAATGILPTAGVGASIAMDSAAALADEMSRADAEHIEYALRLYEKRQKPRVEAAQDNSRQLARLMLIDSAWLASLRNALIRFYTPRRALREIAELMEA